MRSSAAAERAYRGVTVALDPLRFQRDVLPDHRVVGQPHIAAPPSPDDLPEDEEVGELFPGTHSSP